jgi:HD-GYP domain-containing protein (c-di-GMP phosphodiesterase class II)
MDTNSIAGYVAVTGQVLNIPDVYELNADAPVSFNPTFDKEHGYRTKSMLVLPMRNHIDEIIGVIQLINSKEVGDVQTGNEAFEVILETDEDFELKVCPFDERYESLMEAVASQAAIALENNRMLLQIEHQFEEFVKASVSAIESRDPATSGHSFRIAEMCVRAAKAINAKNEGPFAGIFYSKPQLKEIEFAGLLHDFGKVYIDPSIFLKEKKLFSRDFEYLMMRLNFLYRSLELKFDREHIGPEERAEKLSKIKEIMEQVTVLNEPKVQNTDPSEVIDSILALQDELEVEDLKGTDIPILEDKEMTNLKIKRGSLNDEERRIIQSHVEHTYTFVSKIPWPDEYRNIPDIARKHHEKLDGTGYPLGINDVEKLPIASRIMAIADIFDALSATDRPYKRAVPREKIFSILREEAEAGKLDRDLVELFIESRAWDLGSRK